ncbi:MAG: extensin family protein, partial [Pseudomonadota bacterium]
TDGTCFAALETGATFTRMPPLEAEGDCGVDPRLRLTAAAGMTIPPLETTCRSALRLAMWLEHAVRPASEVLGAAPTAIRHQGSYNCRAIRGGTRLSSHATGSAIDVAGVTLDDGRRLELIDGWAGDGPEAAFWRGARDGACRWFVTVLGPDFNAAHADHFHLQAMGWGLCR